MKNLEIAVLYYEGPIARAYLSIFKALGFKVKLLIKLFKGREKYKKLCPFLPNFLRTPFLSAREGVMNNYWPCKFSQDPDLIDAFQNKFSRLYNLPSDFIKIIGSKHFNEQQFAEKISFFELDELGFKSPSFLKFIQTLNLKTILFTGGGILPKAVLEINNKSFIHIHPGCLPYVRGGDGILWSILVRGRPGATCFYMVPELDAGQVIYTQEFPSDCFNLPKLYDYETQYRLVFSFYDTAIRASTLMKILQKHGTLVNLPATPQNLNQGNTYHFMHNRLRKEVLGKIFNLGTR